MSPVIVKPRQNAKEEPEQFTLATPFCCCLWKEMHLDASWVKADNSVPNSWQRGFICKLKVDSRAAEPLGWHMVVSWHRTRVLGFGRWSEGPRAPLAYCEVPNFCEGFPYSFLSSF